MLNAINTDLPIATAMNAAQDARPKKPDFAGDGPEARNCARRSMTLSARPFSANYCIRCGKPWARRLILTAGRAEEIFQQQLQQVVASKHERGRPRQVHRANVRSVHLATKIEATLKPVQDWHKSRSSLTARCSSRSGFADGNKDGKQVRHPLKTGFDARQAKPGRVTTNDASTLQPPKPIRRRTKEKVDPCKPGGKTKSHNF